MSQRMVIVVVKFQLLFELPFHEQPYSFGVSVCKDLALDGTNHRTNSEVPIQAIHRDKVRMLSPDDIPRTAAKR